MSRIMAAKVNHFSIAVDGSLFIFSTMMAEVTFHQPGLSMVGIDFENSIQENLGDFPAFFRDCACGVLSIYTNLRFATI